MNVLNEGNTGFSRWEGEKSMEPLQTGQNVHVDKKELVCIAVSYYTGLENVHQKSMSAQNL